MRGDAWANFGIRMEASFLSAESFQKSKKGLVEVTAAGTMFFAIDSSGGYFSMTSKYFFPGSPALWRGHQKRVII